MPQVDFSANATANLAELVAFLKDKNPGAAVRAAARIRHVLGILAHQPRIGIAVPERQYHRNLPISFGKDGYVARYRYRPGDMKVVVLAIRHGKQAGFTGLD